MYSESESLKLTAKLEYLIGEDYFPFGQKGESFKIKGLEPKLLNRVGSYTDRKAEEQKDPGNKIYKAGNNWQVAVKLTNSVGDESETIIDNIIKKRN